MMMEVEIFLKWKVKREGKIQSRFFFSFMDGEREGKLRFCKFKKFGIRSFFTNVKEWGGEGVEHEREVGNKFQR